MTRWWRGLSLRAKVTGVTVALLAIGLVAAGAGTMAFLRNSLIESLGTQAVQLAGTNVAGSLFAVSVDDGTATFTVDPDAVPTDYFVALYGPDGTFKGSAGGHGASPPNFPVTWGLDETYVEELQLFWLDSLTGGAPFRTTVSLLTIDGVRDSYTQLVALPVAPINQIVGTFIGIYALLALIVVVGGALLTRWLVTLTFRSLGQVETTAMAIGAGDFSLRLTDIEPTTTEVGRLKTALNAMLRRVDAAITQRDSTVRQMRRFIGDASHELRTPLVTVRGWAELYRMGAISGDDDVAQAMDRIESEAKRMGLLVEDLLALARLDERQDVVFSPVDLRPVARDAALDLRATSPLRSVTVIDTTIEQDPETHDESAPHDDDDEPMTSADGAARRRGVPATALARAGATLSLLRRKPRPVPATRAVDVGGPPMVTPIDLTAPEPGPTTTPPIVVGDENRIRQVVANLLGNAKRFTGDDSPIELRVGVDSAAGMGWIEISDHGEGIPDQIKDKIFQRFWRADTSRARETGGTGLGLSIVASIVEALHGRVYAKDTPGGGATFHVDLPLAATRDAREHLTIATQPITSVRTGDGG